VHCRTEVNWPRLMGLCIRRMFQGIHQGEEVKQEDTAMMDVVAYICRDWPESEFELCKESGYEPNGSYSHHAWNCNQLGHCNSKSFIEFVFNGLSHLMNLRRNSTLFVLMPIPSKHLPGL
jgi:hypothetical protein